MFETRVPRPIFDTNFYAFSKPSSKKNTKRVERAIYKLKLNFSTNQTEKNVDVVVVV